MLNRVDLIGHLGKDPEIHTTQDGRPIANFNVATSESWRDKSTGEKREKTEWHRVVCFVEQTAKFIEQYVKKGDKVFITGQLQTRKWTDQSGQDRYSTEVVIRSFRHELQHMGSPTGGNRPPPATSEGEYGEGRPAARPQAASVPAFESGGSDDDIPF